MEEEEEAVEVSDFFADGVDLKLFEGDAVENEIFFFEPLFEEETVGWCRGDLVERVLLLHGLCLIDCKRI